MDTKQLINGQKVYQVSGNKIICLTVERPYFTRSGLIIGVDENGVRSEINSNKIIFLTQREAEDFLEQCRVRQEKICCLSLLSFEEKSSLPVRYLMIERQRINDLLLKNKILTIGQLCKLSPQKLLELGFQKTEVNKILQRLSAIRCLDKKAERIPFAKMSDRELIVLRLIRQNKSLNEIAILSSVTNERIRQIFAKALRRAKLSMGVKRFQELSADELDKIMGNDYFSTAPELSDEEINKAYSRYEERFI